MDLGLGRLALGDGLPQRAAAGAFGEDVAERDGLVRPVAPCLDGCAADVRLGRRRISARGVRAVVHATLVAVVGEPSVHAVRDRGAHRPTLVMRPWPVVSFAGREAGRAESAPGEYDVGVRLLAAVGGRGAV
jgi:hypothetical protein